MMLRGAVVFIALGSGLPAQGPDGSIRVSVIDGVTHQPIKKAQININRVPDDGSNFRMATADANGTAAFDGLGAGAYLVFVSDEHYPNGGAPRSKSLTLAAGETTDIAIALMPGATVSGHVLDEDGDPIERCSVEATSASKRAASGSLRGRRVGEIGEVDRSGHYRMGQIPAGKFVLVARCDSQVFEPRPLSAGPDPPSSLAWATVYYPGTADLMSAQTIELAAGNERSGIDFKMKPRPVTHIHVQLAAVSAAAAQSLSWAMVSLTEPLKNRFAWNGVRVSDNAFDIPNVLPGSYTLLLRTFLRSDEGLDFIGAYLPVTVGKEPVAVSAELRNAVEINGRLETEDGSAPDKVQQMLQNAHLAVMPQVPQIGGVDVKPNADGTFSFRTTFPVRLRVDGTNMAHVKSVSAGGRDLAGGVIDPAAVSGEVRVLLSLNGGTVQGLAPAGSMVAITTAATDLSGFTNASPAGQDGRFKFTGLAPGDYLIASGDVFPFPESTAKAIALHEGETVNVELKPPTDSSAP